MLTDETFTPPFAGLFKFGQRLPEIKTTTTTTTTTKKAEHSYLLKKSASLRIHVHTLAGSLRSFTQIPICFGSILYGHQNGNSKHVWK